VHSEEWQTSMFIKALVLGLAVCACCCVLIAAFTPISRAKGRARLAGSLFIGIAIPLGVLPEAIAQRKAITAVIGLAAGVFLVWVGMRKYRRDPEGRTPSARIL
jgi:hypothetical protein